MGLKNTRTILSILAFIIICASTVLGLASSVFSVTFASQGFLAKHLATQKIVEECNQQLHYKYEALSEEAGIPSRVFETVIKDYSTRDNLTLAASYVFTEESSLLYSEERVEYFNNLCTEYLDGNGIKYNRAEVRRAADKAAVIYSETVGIHNTHEIKEHINEFKNNCERAVSSSIIAIIISAVMLFILYSKKRYASSYIAGGIAGGGVAVVIGSLLSLIFGVGKHLGITPEIYQSGVLSMIRIYFLCLALTGCVIILLASVVPVIINKRNSEDYKKRVTLIEAIKTNTNKPKKNKLDDKAEVDKQTV